MGNGMGVIFGIAATAGLAYWLFGRTAAANAAAPVTTSQPYVGTWPAYWQAAKTTDDAAGAADRAARLRLMLRAGSTSAVPTPPAPGNYLAVGAPCQTPCPPIPGMSCPDVIDGTRNAAGICVKNAQ